MQRNLRINLDSFLAICFIIAWVIPYINYKGRGDILPLIIFFAWITVVILKKDQINRIIYALSFRKFELLLLFIFFLVTIFYYFFITTTKKAFQFTLMPVTYFFVIVMDAYYFRRDPRYKLSIFFVMIVALAIQAAISIPYVFRSDDMVSRMFTAGELEGPALEEALRNGVGSANLYAFLAGVFFLGIGMLGKFSNKAMRMTVLVSLLVILFSLVASSYSISLVMLAIGGLILLIRANWKRIKLKFIFIALFFFTGLGIFYNNFLANSQVTEPIERKIMMVKEGRLREDGRMDLAGVSLKTFLSNPFFGVGVPEWGLEKQVGEHMSWIDLSAHYGFFGFLPFLLFLLVLFRRNYKFYFKSLKSNIYATSCLIGFSIFLFSNCIDPLIFDPPMVITLVFFYTSMFNWGNKPLANEISL
jgi:O-antigen ligase